MEGVNVHKQLNPFEQAIGKVQEFVDNISCQFEGLKNKNNNKNVFVQNSIDKTVVAQVKEAPTAVYHEENLEVEQSQVVEEQKETKVKSQKNPKKDETTPPKRIKKSKHLKYPSIRLSEHFDDPRFREVLQNLEFDPDSIQDREILRQIEHCPVNVFRAIQAFESKEQLEVIKPPRPGGFVWPQQLNPFVEKE
eukprot:TRINITY_DN5774_c0_g2_i2.p1 TRINITY_DN5774_c0_g2~~TRINITY_DN5774_c0_g2_i2.p1  ORF type:complete len:211 (+),score=46.46 TRINITY_DN5774_c0_g2_i2:55-633(+)